MEKEGFNPKAQETVLTKRRQLKTDFELPVKDAYDAFIAKFLML